MKTEQQKKIENTARKHFPVLSEPTEHDTNCWEMVVQGSLPAVQATFARIEGACIGPRGDNVYIQY